ncbi:MAG TPA: circularly permuted type 2 ATP-grasp protein, partial [Gammaproteobacteria bacterium]
LPEMVLKPLDPGDPEGTLIGPAASHKQLAALRARLQAQPAEFVAQPLLALSTCPAFTASGLAPRHVDLRPFVLFGERLRVTPGGLTRVALKKGSLLVHAEHGGGTKDTWVLEQ